MKKTVKTLVIIAAVAMSLASCKKEAISPAGNTVKVSFSAAIDQISKVTLEADAADAVFTPDWVVNDQISLTYSGPKSGTVTAKWDGNKFTAEVAQEVADAVGDWSYSVAYGAELGDSFTQDGDAFNGAYDMMTGSISVTGSKFLQDGGEAITFPMVRQKGILYFHLSGTRSAIAEPITAATLKCGEKTISVTVDNGTALNAAGGHKFWFCLPEGEYSAVSFSAETASYKFEVATKDGQALNIAKGKLAKMVGTVSADNYSFKGEQPVFGPGVFDSCDYSPFVVGNTVSSGASLCEGTVGKAYGFNFNVEENKLIGPMYVKRSTALTSPAGLTDANGILSFYIYTDKAVEFAASAGRQLIVELTTSGAADAEEYQWMLWEGGAASQKLASLPVGWTKLELNLSEATKTGTPDLAKGFNFFRVYFNGNNVAGEYNVKLDEITVIKKSNYNADGIAAFTSYPKDQNGNAVSGLQFRNTHPVFSADKKTAYVSSTIGHIVAIDLEEGAVKWVYTPSTTSGCATICVNPVTGDIYGTNKAALCYAIRPDGTKRWEYSGMMVRGACFTVSTDGSTLFAIGGPTTGTDANRLLHVIDATNGTLLQKYDATAAGGNNNIYTNNAQIVIFNQDSNYDYVAMIGNQLISIHKYNKSSRKLEFISRLDAKPVNNKGTAASQSCTDISSAAVSPDKKTVYFLGGSYTSGDKSTWHHGNVFVLNVENPASASIKYAKIENTTAGVAASGLVMSEDNKIVVTCGPNVSTYSASAINAGGTPSAIAKVKVSGGNTNSYNFICPSVSASGNIYFSIDNVAPACIYKSAVASTTVTKVCDPGVSATAGSMSFQGVFAMTDGYAVVGTPAGIYVKKLEGETIAPNTWGYFGGDPCGSKNANLVYGNN